MASYSWKKTLRKKVPSLGSRPKFSHKNSRIDFGSLIYEASKQGDFEGLELILSQSGASHFVNTAGRDGLTPLTVAAKNGDLSCVKLLLANKCDLHLKGHLNGREKFAWEISSEFGHPKITEYLNGCVDDLIKYHYHRAMMEADVIEICCTSTITKNDLYEFHKHMTRLLKMDTFCLDGDELTPSLIVLAAEADNKLIVEQLLEKYNATPFANNHNGETALHLACRKKSDLRYYLTKKVPQLLFAVNVEGIQPLHISCENNDVEYFSWIFQSVLEDIERKGVLSQENASKESVLQSSLDYSHMNNSSTDQSNSLQDDSKPSTCNLLEDSSEIHAGDSQSSILSSSSPTNLQKTLTTSFLETTCSFLKQTCNTYGNSPLTIQDILSLHMRLFAIDIHGLSILHIAAKHGFVDLLQLVLEVAKVFEHSPDSIDLKILTNSDASINPIEQAITANQPICLKLLLDFASMTPIFGEITKDVTLFTTVINTGNKETVEVLLEFGLSNGLKKAINLAELTSKNDLLRMLLFYQTQLTCYLYYQRHKQIDVKKSLIFWDQLDLQQVDKDWIGDAKVAVASVFHTINELGYSHSSKNNRDVFMKLGKCCIDYFKVFVWLPQTCPYSWQSCIITELNLSGNQLELIPLEVFQIQTLLCLDLSHNNLHRLPSSLNIQNPLYKCHGLAKLNLSSNILQTLPEDFFFAFGRSLEELRVNNNLLETLPPGLWICPALHTLSLGRNKLQQLHYFSDKKFFYDESFSRSLINGVTIEGGVPINCGNLDDEQFMNMIKYVTRLNIFYQTVKVLMPEVIEEDIKNDASLLQHVIDIHWLRSKLSSGKQTINSQYFDVSLPPDECCALKTLDLSYNDFSIFPWDIACVMPNLEKLDMRGNQLKSCNIVKNLPSNIESVILSDNVLTSVVNVFSNNPCGSPVKLISGYLSDPKVHGECRHTEHNVLSKATNIILNCNKLTEFSCTREPATLVKSLQRSKSLDSSQYQCLFPNLSVLSLDQNHLQAVPFGIQFLNQLSSLSLSHNVSISRIPPEIGIMNPQTLLIFKLEGVYPKNVDSQLLKKPGARALLTYLKMLHQRSVSYYRLKLMIIGNCNVGKTSLLLSLTSKGKVTRFKDVERGVNKLPLSTVGVDLGDWEYQMSKRPKVTFMTWDFGGQEEYYATHQCFLTRRSLYVLVWNVEMNEAGLASLKPWLENIGGRVPGAPVVVVGTHIDSIPLEKRSNVLKHFNVLFQRMYLDVTPRAFPSIYKKCFFVSSFDGTNISSFRDELYEFALSIKPIGRQYGNSESLVKQQVPECYIRLQDRVRDIAQRCSKEKRHPVLTTEEIKDVAFSSSCFDNIDELEQGIQFLHENGILLHYDDPALSDLYFVDPQWLCSILAHVVTIHEKNPFQKNGFMEFSALQLLLKDTKFPNTMIKELVSLMQKFEVAHLLNNKYILIPSLLPSDESSACIVSSSCSSYNSASSFRGTTTVSIQTFSGPNVSIFVRYYLLPFIPNGFFPRVIARILGSDISEFFSEHLSDNGKNLHWQCWRTGIVLVIGSMEVVRISPVRLPMANVDDIVLISSSSHHEILLNDHNSIIQVVVSIFPEKLVHDTNAVQNESIDIAIWILQKLIDIIDSVFDDWYDAFARINGFDSEAVKQASPCTKCLQQTATHTKDHQESSISTITSQLSSYISSQRTLHLFSSPFCVVVASRNKCLTCPVHGPIRVSDVSPDLAFADFPRDDLFYEPDSSIQKLESLGVGGFGSVHKGILEHNGNRQRIAIKEFLGVSCKQELEGDEAFYWDIYLTGSKEARMMNYLRHPNILSLIGLAFNPLRLLLELAPKGDLKDCIKPFKKLQYKLSRQVLKLLMYQLADAMDYIHSKKVIYRDMKPGNILVWEFPHPKSRWNDGVLVKLADYGISKYCTPEGVRGSEGTPAYLPPEVIVGGGSTSYSTKLDVYSYGMVLYYLFTYLGPFETHKGRPISALLDEGMRPEMSAVNQPLAVRMYELMCWCWDDKPACRPTFTQIKSVINQDTFTHLVGSSALPYDDDVYTTVSVQTYHAKNTGAENGNDLNSSTAVPSPSVANLLAASIIQDQTTRVWYGTKQGRLGYIQFPSLKNSFIRLHDLKHPITCVCACGNQVWVGTNGGGVTVYDSCSPDSNAIATWNQKEIIHQILYVKVSDDVIVLTTNGIVVFETFKIKVDAQVPLIPSRTYCINPILVYGISVPRASGDHEVWCCSTSGRLKIFDISNFNTVVSLVIAKAESYVLQYFEVNNHHKVAVSMGNLLQIWDVDTRKQEGGSFDTHTSCYTLYGPNAERSFISSLLVNKDIIYIGTRGGVLLVFNYSLQKVVSVLHGYSNTISCLASISPMYFKIRGITKQQSQIDNLSLDRSSISSFSGSTTNSMDSSKHEDCIVLSFGKSCIGMVDNIKNSPKTFLSSLGNCYPCVNCFSLPGMKCMCGQNNHTRSRRPTKPDSKANYMLFWFNDNH